MVETNVQLRCLYVEEVSSLPQNTPEESSKKSVKRKNVESTTSTTASKKLNSGIRKEMVSTISIVSVLLYFTSYDYSGTDATYEYGKLGKAPRKSHKRGRNFRSTTIH